MLLWITGVSRSPTSGRRSISSTHRCTTSPAPSRGSLPPWVTGGSRIANIGTQVELIPPVIDELEQSAGKLDVTLAALAGGMGGAAGQAANLAVSMIQTNGQLAEGEKEFTKTEIGAALVGAALQSIGEAVGGTAGKVLSAAGTMASAFATGGPLGVAIAGIGILIEGLISMSGPSEAELAARKTFGAWHKRCGG